MLPEQEASAASVVEVINDFTKAIQLDPDDASNYAQRGFSYAELDQDQNAINDYTKAIQLDPDDALAYVGRFLVYTMLGQDALANADNAKACSLDSQWC